MNTLTIGANIKKLRGERNITQQQLADAVGVTFQAVSKWENGATVPDVGTLPEIADFFDVTIDDLFKPNMTAYKNKAGRLMSVYESDTNNSEAFEKADNEFKKLFAGNSFDADDVSNYAYLNDCRSHYYIRTAEHYYLDANERGSKIKDDAYYSNQRQYIGFLSHLGRSHESVERHLAILENEPDNPMNYASLIAAYKSAGDMENAYLTAKKGLHVFPDNATILVYAGDTCKILGKFDEAVEYWDRAFDINPEMIDTRFSTVFYLMEQGQNKEAENVWEQIIKWNEQRGFEIENKWVKRELNKLRNISQ